MAKVIIEDNLHSEQHGEYDDQATAIAELRRLADIPWDAPPNQPPCANWQDCGRSYELIEYDDSQRPWKEIGRAVVLTISKSGVQWVSQ